VRKHGPPSVEDGATPGYELALDRLLDMYRVNAAPIDLTDL